MLFNSYPFIFVFLPIVLFGFFFAARFDHRAAALWLSFASVFFYGWWNPKFVLLLLSSIAFNYSAGYLIGHARSARRSRAILVSAITVDLGLLALFKYANFFIDTANTLGSHLPVVGIVLPLGISFFTFTQIAFLVDVHRRLAKEYDVIHYLLFVTWFPHLIAGPVLHHSQMMPQFARVSTYQPDGESLAVGLTQFSLGLFKKVILADQFAIYANPLFNAAARGDSISSLQTWMGAVAYTLQLYFDFSGYSDMALGLSRVFNIRLPLNFNSPYKAANIIDFWHRWHITLSAFLRDYLYIPLGGNRKGPLLRHVNLMATMLLGGLWHGAGWNFVVWGGLHGIYLVVNHGFRRVSRSRAGAGGNPVRVATTLLTFVAVVIAWVPFRAADLHTTISLWWAMFRSGEGAWPDTDALTAIDPVLNYPLIEVGTWICAGLAIVWFLPNSQQWLGRFHPALETISVLPTRLAWRPGRAFAVGVGLLFAISVMSLRKNSPFLYFQF